LNKAVKIIANSRYTADLIQTITKKASVVAIPLAVNHAFFKPLPEVKKQNDKLNLCSVSRIEQFKGHDFIIKTIARLPSAYQSKLQYNIAGTGAYLPVLRQLVKQLDLENTVSFSGFVADMDLPDFYNRNDLFILCTRESPDSTSVEGFGLVFLEAQSCGIPAIGARTGGIPDAVHEENGGWLIEQDNQEELSVLLLKLIDSPNLIEQMGEKARRRVEQSATWDIYCEKIFNLMSL
jgi:phosphatidylinositol alpha-1,6-mannosyltransferase